jgi:transposase InsO family protein
VQSVSGQVAKLIIALQIVISDSRGFCTALFRSRTALAAENLFLRKQLALFQERDKRARPTTAADRFVFSKLARFFDWRSALVIVKPATLIGWHRAAFRRFWRWKSRPVGRPLNACHLRRTLREWTCHYNAGRPHRSLGPGIPDALQQTPPARKQPDRLCRVSQVIAKPILGGLHHEYRWPNAA